MIALPPSLILSAVLIFVLIKSHQEDPRFGPFQALLGAAALQGGMVSLVHYYQIDALRPIMPLTATALPPLAWIAFRSQTQGRQPPSTCAPHAIAPLFTLFCLLFAPITLDAVLTLIFVGYGIAILLVLAKAPDLPLAQLSAGSKPLYLWRALGGALILSGVSDVLITGAMMLGQPGWTPIILSLFSTAALLAVAVLALMRDDLSPAQPDPIPAPAPREVDTNLLQRLEGLLTQEQLYLQSDLTLSRLARRLGVPAKTLSATINAAHQENVSRYVNGYRIRHACDLLQQGLSVTETIYASGFNTKSNFNREFSRITGQSPRDWLAMQSTETAD
jgi:AraC-like DNA-binding protein